MLRPILLSSTLLVSPALADTLSLTAPVTDVTLFPQGATVTRTATLNAPAGVHELVVTGLPADTDAASLRIEAEGAKVGAMALQTDRAAPAPFEDSAEVVAAREALHRLEAALRERDARSAAIRARAQAAEDTVAFIRGLAQAAPLDPAQAEPLIDTASSRLLAAREAAVRAATEAANADVGREQDVRAVEQARARLAALEEPAAGKAALVLTVETSAEPATLRISSAVQDASWEPTYDFRLNTAEKSVTMDRGLLVRQASGEDWQNANLVLSTARPSEQAGASTLDPWFPRIGKEAPPIAYADAAPAAAPMARAKTEMVAEMSGGYAGSALSDMIGATVVYRYPAPVQIRSGVDAVRLNLDSHALPAEITADAVPAQDQTAFLTAKIVNDLKYIILPGPATLYSDGAMVGQVGLAPLAPGKDVRLGFGPIDGIRLERRIPDQSEGQRGLISSANTREETAVLRIENMTGQSWPLRVLDRVPVSTQDDLKVDWSASPRPSEIDPEGKRGILIWTSELAPKEVKEITVTTKMRWPSGQVLLPDFVIPMR